MLILFGAYECVACYRVANTDMCKLHATRGVLYVKMGCYEKYVKFGCSSMLIFPKAGKVHGAGQGGRDFYYKPFFSLFFLFSPIDQDKPVVNVAGLSLMSKSFQSYAINQFTGFTFLH